MIDAVELVLNIFITFIATFTGIVVGMWATKKSTKEITDSMLRLSRDENLSFRNQ